jgi:hypothetical protein
MGVRSWALVFVYTYAMTVPQTIRTNPSELDAVQVNHSKCYISGSSSLQAAHKGG